MTPEDNIKNAFANVIKVYEEISSLLDEFSALLQKKGFSGSKKNHQFCAPFSALSLEKNSNSYRLSILVTFVDLEHKTIVPRLVIGVVKYRRANIWELWNAYFNEQKRFTYTRETNIKCTTEDYLDVVKMDQEVIKFDLINPGKQTLYLPTSGNFFAVPLLSVSNRNHIKDLSEKAVRLWEDKAV